MKSIQKRYAFWMLVALSVSILSCSSDDDGEVIVPEEILPGDADFSNYVSIGNSLTAGYTDGALFMAGQANSFPNLLAQQMSLAGGGDFTQPMMSDNLGGLLLGGNQIVNNRLYFNGTGPALVEGTPTTDITNILSGPFNNMGVPGAKSYHLIAPGYGNISNVAVGAANPYFVRFASSPNATVLGDAVAQNPTFFTLWIGNNDVLGYATAGGAGVDQTGNFDPATYGSSDITDPNVFAAVYSQILEALVGTGADGVLANIPDVTTIPYLTTVPYNPIGFDAGDPVDEGTVALLNQNYAAYNAGLDQIVSFGGITAEEAEFRKIVFKVGMNPVVIVDEYLTNLTTFRLPSYRFATENDLVVLPAANFIGTTVGGNPSLVNGVSVPLEDRWVLTPQEQELATAAVENFNNIISSLADEYGIPLIDANALLAEIASTGVAFDDYILKSNLVTGGFFSLDGVHPNSRGYAFITNVMIDVINANYGSNLPKLKAGDFSTTFPQNLP